MPAKCPQYMQAHKSFELSARVSTRSFIAATKRRPGVMGSSSSSDSDEYSSPHPAPPPPRHPRPRTLRDLECHLPRRIHSGLPKRVQLAPPKELVQFGAFGFDELDDPRVRIREFHIIERERWLLQSSLQCLLPQIRITTPSIKFFTKY